VSNTGGTAAKETRNSIVSVALDLDEVMKRQCTRGGVAQRGVGGVEWE
jgi:hypothetical protein